MRNDSIARRRIRKFGPSAVGALAATLLVSLNGALPASASGTTPHHQLDQAASAVASLDAIDVSQLDAITQRSPFVGESFDPQTGTITIHQSSAPSAPIIASLKAVPLPEPWHLTFDNVPNSWNTLSSVMNDLTNRTFEGSVPSDVTMWTIDTNTDTVQIGLTHRDSQVEDTLNRMYGKSLLSFIQRDQAYTTSAQAAGQTRDSEGKGPYHAGAWIHIKESNAYCTAGFYIRVNGTNGMLSAGHCGTGTGNSTVQEGHGNYTIGTVQSRSFDATGDFDTEWYTGTFSSYVWVGGTDSGTGNAITGTYAPAQGASICQDGDFTYEKCGIIMNSSSDACVVIDYSSDNAGSHKICHLRYAYAPSGIAITKGDSGGPVIADDGSTVRAVGTNVGETGSGNTSGGMYYTPISELLAKWNASLVTN